MSSLKSNHQIHFSDETKQFPNSNDAKPADDGRYGTATKPTARRHEQLSKLLEVNWGQLKTTDVKSPIHIYCSFSFFSTSSILSPLCLFDMSGLLSRLATTFFPEMPPNPTADTLLDHNLTLAYKDGSRE